MKENELITDLHLHSKYSRAVSQNMVIEEMSRQAKRKGIGLLATGDWLHLLWFRQLETDLQETNEGIFSSRKNPEGAKFLLAAEISSVYQQQGRLRRVHTLLFSPSLAVAKKIGKELAKRGCNLTADGRPIVGLSVQAIAELVFSVSEKCMIIPAHIWTPWFSLYGSKSGFDRLTEAYGKFAAKIYAVETGLSSDPEMNWRIQELQNRAILSFSDAHSGLKLGREATVFKFKESGAAGKAYTYNDVYEAIGERMRGRNKGNLELVRTIEFYPEEGKYHYTGHRKCGVIQSPEESRRKGVICHVCGKPLTVGVMHRVEQLAGRPASRGRKISREGLVEYVNQDDESRPGYVMLVPLIEILAQVYGVGSASKKVKLEYERLLKTLGSEFTILMQTEVEKIGSVGGARLAQAVSKVREGSIQIVPGYDGVFGTVKIWPEKEMLKTEEKEQMTLF